MKSLFAWSLLLLLTTTTTTTAKFVVQAMASPTPQPAVAGDFCSRTISVRNPSCSAPAGTGGGPDLDARALVGSFYEVGSTARYRLRHEAGLGCAQTTFFTLAASNNNNNTSTSITSTNTNHPSSLLLRFESSAVTLLPPLSRRSSSALSSLSYASSAACSAASRLCFSTHSPRGRLPLSLSRISASFPSVSAASPYDAATLSLASATLNASSSASRLYLDSLAASVAAASAVAAKLAQDTAPSPPVLGDLRLAVATAADHAREFAKITIGNVTYVEALLSQVVEHVSGIVPPQTRELLQEAKALLQQHMDAVTNQVMNLEELLGGIGGPSTDILAADTRRIIIGVSRNNSDRVETVPENGHDEGSGRVDSGVSGWYGGRRVTISSGRAVQQSENDREEEGGGEDEEEEVGRLRMAYRIIGAVAPEQGAQVEEAETEEAAQQYGAVLVSRCEEEEGEVELVEQEEEAAAADQEAEEARRFAPAAINDVIVLSSSPTISPATLRRLLDLAASHGLFTDCDAAFVPSLQRPDGCAAPPPR